MPPLGLSEDLTVICRHPATNRGPKHMHSLSVGSHVDRISHRPSACLRECQDLWQHTKRKQSCARRASSVIGAQREESAGAAIVGEELVAIGCHPT